MRFPYQQVGTFNRESGTYHVERIPMPPEARAVVEVDPMCREVVTGYDVKVACPKCLAPTVLSWRHRTSEHAMEYEIGLPAAVALEATNVARDATYRAERAERAASSSERAFRAIQVTKAKRATRKRRRRSQRGRK